MCNDHTQCGMKPGRLIMNFGDSHLYEEHLPMFKEVMDKYTESEKLNLPTYKYNKKDIYEFTKDSITIENYTNLGKVKYLLKA